MGIVESKQGAGARPVTSWKYSRLRDRTLTRISGLLRRSTRTLWFVETAVLSARYQQWLRSADWARGASDCSDRLEVWKIAQTLLSPGHSTALEFGVADGLATAWWAETKTPFLEWHGFDTFQGLPEAWGRAGVEVMAAGVFTPQGGSGSVPVLDTAYTHVWHRGLIEDTLPGFERPAGSLFVLIDVDLFEPTVVILDWLAKYGQTGDLIYFDEAFDPWNEGQAIRDALATGLELQALAYSGSALLCRVS